MREKVYSLVGLLVAAASSRAAVISIPAMKDAMIFGTSANADTNMASGKGPGIFVGADNNLNRLRSLIQFDIAGNIPAGAQVTGVTMTLRLGLVAGGGAGGSNLPNRTLNLFALQQDWGEGASGSPTSPSMGGTGQGYPRVTGDSSWDYAIFDSGNAATGKWNAGGPDLHGGNFSATASASSTFTAPFVVNNPYTWSSAGLVTDVQAWLDAPSSNHGWLLRAMNGLDAGGNTVSLEDTSTSFLAFWTKDGAAANNNPLIAPALSITYEIPEPTSFGLLLISAPFALRRKRRAVVKQEN